MSNWIGVRRVKFQEIDKRGDPIGEPTFGVIAADDYGGDYADLWRSLDDLNEAIVQGAVKRLRPKFMTFATMFLGLLPIMWSAGSGSDVMKRIAAPMVGGIFTSFLLELLVYPAIYAVWRQRSLARITLSEEDAGTAALGSLEQREDSFVTLKL